MGNKLLGCPVEKHLRNVIDLQMKWRKLFCVFGAKRVEAVGPLASGLFVVFMPVFIYLCHVVVVLLQLARSNIFSNFFRLRVKDDCRVVEQLVSCVVTYFIFCLNHALRDLRGRVALWIYYFRCRRELRVFWRQVFVPRSDACFYLFFNALLVPFDWTLFGSLLCGRLVLSFSLRRILVSLRFGCGDRACPLRWSGDYLPHGWVLFAFN